MKLETNLRELWHCSCCDNDFVSSPCPSSVEMVWCTDDIMLTSEGFEDLETVERHREHLREQGWRMSSQRHRPGAAVAFLGPLLFGQGPDATR